MPQVGNAFVGDQHLIRKVAPTGATSLYVGGASATGGYKDGAPNTALFYYTLGIRVDAAGDVFNADGNGIGAGNRIRETAAGVAGAAGLVSTIAGSGTPGFTDGTGVAASFSQPAGIAVDGAGNLYVADSRNHRIRKITPAGVVTTVADGAPGPFADGTGTAAAFNQPMGLAAEADGTVYVADTMNHRIRKVTPGGEVTTVAGSGSPTFADGAGAAASFNQPQGVAVDSTGTLYVADTMNSRIRKIAPVGTIGELRVTWSAPAGAIVNVYVATANAAEQPTRSCNTATLSCTITGLTSGVEYTITVTATNAAGTSPASPPRRQRRTETDRRRVRTPSLSYLGCAPLPEGGREGEVYAATLVSPPDSTDTLFVSP